MGFEYSTDSHIQSYLVYKIRLGTHGRSNVETSLSKGANHKTSHFRICHVVVTYEQSTSCITTLLIVTMPQHIVITFQKNIRLVRELVNEGQIVTSTL
jgi:hypothetical protein